MSNRRYNLPQTVPPRRNSRRIFIRPIPSGKGTPFPIQFQQFGTDHFHPFDHLPDPQIRIRRPGGAKSVKNFHPQRIRRLHHRAEEILAHPFRLRQATARIIRLRLIPPMPAIDALLKNQCINTDRGHVVNHPMPIFGGQRTQFPLETRPLPVTMVIELQKRSADQPAFVEHHHLISAPVQPKQRAKGHPAAHGNRRAYHGGNNRCHDRRVSSQIEMRR